MLVVNAKTSSSLSITNVHWDFGDGSTLDVPYSTQSYITDTRSHIYRSTGTFTVTATAYDTAGNSGTASLTMTNVTPGSCASDPFFPSSEPTVSNAVVNQATSLQLPSGGQLYLYGFVTGGGASSSTFSDGQYASVVNNNGNVVAALAVTTSNSNSYTTQSRYYSIGGASISGYSSNPTESYATDSSPGSAGVSAHFTVSTSGSLVVVVALGGDEQCLTVAGLTGFSIDATNNKSPSQPNVITIGHAYLDANSYTVTDQTQQCAGSQQPNNAGNMIGVFVFQPSTTTSSGPAISSVSTITAANTQTMTISGSGFGNTPPQTVPLSDGSIDTYACNVNTPSLAISDSGPGSNSWSAGRQTCNGSDAIGIYITSWSDTQIVLTGFGSSELGTNGAKQWNIAAGDPLVVRVWGPNENGPAQYSATVGNSGGTSNYESSSSVQVLEYWFSQVTSESLYDTSCSNTTPIPSDTIIATCNTTPLIKNQIGSLTGFLPSTSFTVTVVVSNAGQGQIQSPTSLGGNCTTLGGDCLTSSSPSNDGGGAPLIGGAYFESVPTTCSNGGITPPPSGSTNCYTMVSKYSTDGISCPAASSNQQYLNTGGEQTTLTFNCEISYWAYTAPLSSWDVVFKAYSNLITGAVPGVDNVLDLLQLLQGYPGQPALVYHVDYSMHLQFAQGVSPDYSNLQSCISNPATAAERSLLCTSAPISGIRVSGIMPAKNLLAAQEYAKIDLALLQINTVIDFAGTTLELGCLVTVVGGAACSVGVGVAFVVEGAASSIASSVFYDEINSES